MGSWGYGIMQSDRALDLEAELYELAGVLRDYEEDDIPQKGYLLLSTAEGLARFEQSIENLESKIAQAIPREQAYKYQVLMTMIMNNGAHVKEDLWKKMTEFALNDGDYTEYLASAHESEKNPRGVAIEHFRCLAQMYYPGVPAKNQDDSLLARLFKS